MRTGGAPGSRERQMSRSGRSAGSRWRRAWRWYGDRLWPTVVLFSVLAVTATLTNSPGRYIGDNRFEQYFNPARRAAKTLSIWDASRGLGRVREDFWPGTTIPMAAFRALGASPILTEHLWHALVLVIAGIGMVQVLRIFRPRIGAEHLLAGVVMSFGAFSASFLTPFSNLYFQYALAPWFVWVFYKGLHSEHSWRWAAGLALLVLAPGNVDTPGLIYNLMPLIAVSIYAVLVERSIRFRHLVGFVARAAPLALMANAAVLVKVYQGAATYGQRLNDTEAADISFRASSWTESIRGLGNWLSYYRDSGRLLKPQGELYFSNWFVILCTFVAPVIALAVIWLSRWRPRIMFGMMALTSLVVLVGAYPLNEPSPLGGQVYKAFNNVTAFFVFRNTYKAGAGLVMGVAALFGCGAVAIVRRLWNRRPTRSLALVPAGLVVVAIVVTAFPFWTNNLYNPSQQSGDLPAYWTSAFEYLDEQPDGARVLIVPETSRSRYRWGWVGDDIFDALLARPHAVATGVMLSTPLAANLLEAASNEAANPAYKAGTLAPILRRLGISRVILRNDLDWKSLNRPRPASYQGFRDDPDFRRASAFGAAGENTVAPDDTSTEADIEKKLPPVEIWELKSRVSDVVRVEAPQPSLLVSGDGAAWGPLATAGVLSGAGPVEYSGNVGEDRLRELIDGGSSIAVTDTNRRRLRVLLSYEPDYSHTLAEGQDLDRTTQTLFTGPGTQSVAWLPDAKTVEASGAIRPVGGSQPWYRATNAVDGDKGTLWLMRRPEARDRSLMISLREPKEVSRAVFVVANTDKNEDGITRAILRFSDGSEEPVNLGFGALNRALDIRTVTVSFPPRTTSSVELVITESQGERPLVGLADVEFEGLDLREHIQVPDDIFSAAAADPDLRARVERAPLRYTFTRSVGEGPVSEEMAIRRRFRSVGNRSFKLQGTARITTTVSDEAIDRLAGAPVGAYGTSRADGAPENWAGAAVDGDVRTGWEPPARAGETIVMRFPKQQVTSVSLSSVVETGVGGVKRVLVVVGDHVEPVDLVVQQPCPVAPSKACRVASLTIPPTEVDHVEIRLTELEPGGAGKVRIDEVVVNGKRNSPLPAGVLDDCHDVGVRIADDRGDVQPVPVKITGTLGDLLAGRTVTFESCGDVRIGEGWHLLDSGGGSAIDSIGLIATDGRAEVRPIGQRPTVEIDPRSPTRVHVSAESQSGAVVILQQSYARAWQAKLNGEALGSGMPLDTLNGWTTDETGHLDIEIVYGGQLIYGVGLMLTGLGVGLCLFLVLHRPRAALTSGNNSGGEPGHGGDAHRIPAMGPAPPDRRVSVPALVGTSAFAAVVAYLLAGAGFAVVLGAIAIAVFVYRSDPGRPVAMGAFVLLVMAAVATVIEVTPSSSDPNLNFALLRHVTTWLGTLVGALTAAAVALFAVTERSIEPASAWFTGRYRSAVWRERWRSVSRLADRWAPIGLAMVLAGALAYLLGPPLSPAYDGLIRSLRVGSHYSLTGLSAEPTGVVPPIAPGLTAFAPFSGPVLVSLLAMAGVVLVARVTHRMFGYRAAAAAAYCAALLPAVWAVQLSVAIAGVAIIGATMLAEPSRLTARRAVAAGLWCAIAGLSRPDALLIGLPVLVVWNLSARRDRRAWQSVAYLFVTASLAMAPWLTFLRANFDTLLPADSLANSLHDPNGADRYGGVAGLVLGVAVVAGSGVLLVMRRVEWPRFVRTHLPFIVLPAACLVLAVVYPVGRDALGWSGPLVAVLLGYGLEPMLVDLRRRQALGHGQPQRTAGA